MRKLVVLAALGVAASSQAATINLINVGGVDPGSPSAKAFQAAANFWAARLTNNVTINLDVGYANLGGNILGSTSSNFVTESVGSVVGRIQAGGNSQLDAYAKTSLNQWSGGSLSVITPGYINTAAQTGVNAKTRVWDNNGSTNNTVLGLTSANAKALGFAISPSTIDATIKFSNQYNMDFDPTNGIGANQIDFVGIAVHEIGHALGFVSGADDYDYFGSPKGPGFSSYASLNPNNDWWGYSLDLFRYNSNAKALGGSGAKMDWAPGDASYFSIDGGHTYKGGYFSTGSFNGDGWQASHWKRTSGKPALGVMDPAVAFGQQDVVRSLDLAAFDAIGWNIDFNVLGNPNWMMSTAQIGLASGLFSSQIGGDIEFGRPLGVAAVPEPANWALLIAGFGLSGAAMRRRSNRVKSIAATLCMTTGA